MERTKTRKYDVVVLGANGYTTSICAEYIAKNMPTNLRWAVAGRSEVKLLAFVAKLEKVTKIANSLVLLQ